MLEAWAAAPARFREDANAEEELALGAYRGRLVVELAQNAADAARAAGQPGRVRFTLTDDLLVVANTGAPLDRPGVEALSTLRASAKRDGGGTGGSAVGRFGVGFSAVRTVSDSPAVASRSGAVRWSLVGATAAIAAVPALAAEATRRGDALPVLRLPFPADLVPPPGFDTAVFLRLRDATARDAVRRELADLDPALLLTLPDLELVEVDGRRLTSRRSGPDVVVIDDDEQTRWRVVRRTGRLDPATVADRPVEERLRASWEVMCAVPVAGEPAVPAALPSSVPAVLRGPTVTDDGLSLPAVVVGSWPLDSTRRRIASGPLRAALVEEAATAYAEVVRDLAETPAVLDLVPTGLAAGEVDAELRAAVLDRLVETPFVPLAEDAELRVRPRDAVAADVPADATDVLAAVLPGLLPAAWAARLAPLAVLGVRRLGLAEVVDALAGLDRAPAWWRRLYAALAGAHLGGPERDALGALPVPLADGRLVAGPRGRLLAGDAVDGATATTLGLRVVHPEAAHPLLELLGARSAAPRSLLDDARLQAAVTTSYDAPDPESVAEAVLRVVAAAGLRPGELPWLAELALPAQDGELYPAGELLLPGSALAAVMSPDAPFGTVAADLVQRCGAAVLLAVGVLDSFAVLRANDVLVDPAMAEHDLDAEAAWLLDVREAAGASPEDEPPVLAELVAVRDLEFVAPDAWSRALPMLPPTALTEPALVLLGGGRRVAVPPYTRWWLARAPVLAGRRPRDLAVPGSELAGLYDDAPAGADPALLLRLGVRSGVEELLAEPGGAAELLARLGSDRPVDRDAVRRLHARLSRCDAPPPARVRAVRDGVAVAVDPADAVVVEAPDLLPLVGRLAVVPAPLPLAADIADLLDVPLAGELADYPVVSAGTQRRTGLGRYLEHRPLLVANLDGRPTPVPWRVDGGVAHVDAGAGPEAAGRALAWRDGRWGDRWLLAALLGDPGRSAALLAERDLDP